MHNSSADFKDKKLIFHGLFTRKSPPGPDGIQLHNKLKNDNVLTSLQSLNPVKVYFPLKLIEASKQF